MLPVCNFSEPFCINYKNGRSSRKELEFAWSDQSCNERSEPIYYITFLYHLIYKSTFMHFLYWEPVLLQNTLQPQCKGVWHVNGRIRLRDWWLVHYSIQVWKMVLALFEVPIEIPFPRMTEMISAVLSNMIAAGFLWLLNTGNVAGSHHISHYSCRMNFRTCRGPKY